MKKWTYPVWLSVFSLLSAAVAQEVTHEPFTVDLGDFESQAELIYPKGQIGPFPTVLLVHSSSPMDKDGSVFGFDKEGRPIVEEPVLNLLTWLTEHSAE